MPLPVTEVFTSIVKQGMGGGGFDTVTVMVGAVPTLPAGSVAVAPSWCVPFATLVVSQAKPYGAAVSSGPSGLPSRSTCTEATETLSVALAATGVVPETV